MSEGGAAVLTDMLVAVVREGTGRKAQTLQRPVAGKTGTTDDFKDALFIGFSPEITVGVWVGQDGSESLGKGETGAKAALPIWTDYMEAFLKTRPFQYFDIPDGRAALAPVSYGPNDVASSLPTQTPQAVSGLKPMNRASLY